jgi:hypothetical protein
MGMISNTTTNGMQIHPAVGEYRCMPLGGDAPYGCSKRILLKEYRKELSFPPIVLSGHTPFG